MYFLFILLIVKLVSLRILVKLLAMNKLNLSNNHKAIYGNFAGLSKLTMQHKHEVVTTERYRVCLSIGICEFESQNTLTLNKGFSVTASTPINWALALQGVKPLDNT